MLRKHVRGLVVMLAALGMLGFTACDDGDDIATVEVLLSEWIVEPNVSEVDAGEVAFEADNQGGETHELVVVRSDDPADLPTDESGVVDESQIADEDFIGEIEEFASKEQRSATFTLAAGSYVLFCNIVETEEDGTVESHFVEGMVNTLEAT